MTETIFLRCLTVFSKFAEVINASEFSLNKKAFSGDTEMKLRSWSEDWECLLFSEAITKDPKGLPNGNKP